MSNGNQTTKKEITKKKLRLIENALKVRQLKPNAKVILTQLLLSFYNNTTGQCNPSQQTLAKAVGMDKRRVQRAIRQLKECGCLLSQQQFNRSNQYRFNWQYASSNDDENVVMTELSWGDDKFVMGGRQNCRVNDDKTVVLTIEGTIERTNEKNTHTSACESNGKEAENPYRLHSANSSLLGKNHRASPDQPAPPIAFNFSPNESFSVEEQETNVSPENNSIPHPQDGSFRPSGAPVASAAAAAYDDASGEPPPRPYNEEYEQFWRIYPKQIDDKNAYRAFVAAVKDSNGNAGTIIQGAYMYANWCKVELIKPEQQRYIPYPEKWLDKKGWTDRARMLDGATNDPNRPSMAMANSHSNAPSERDSSSEEERYFQTLFHALKTLSALYSCVLSSPDEEITHALIDQMKPYYKIMDSPRASDKKIDLFGQYLSDNPEACFASVKPTQPTVTELDLAYSQLTNSELVSEI